MNISRRARAAILIGAALVVASCIYPPWMTDAGQSGSMSRGYAFLWAGELPDQWALAVIDMRRLLVSWALIAALAAAVFVLTPDRD